PARGGPPLRETGLGAPASTGATEAASVAGRTASHHTRAGLRDAAAACKSGPLGKSRKIGFPLLDIGVAAFLRLLAQVVEQRRVAGQLLDTCETIIGGVEPRL